MSRKVGGLVEQTTREIYRPWKEGHVATLAPWGALDARKANDAFKTNAREKQEVVNRFNFNSWRYSNHLITLMGGTINFVPDHHVNLSSEGAFPDLTTHGIPQAIRFSEADRKAVDTRWTQIYNVQDRRSDPSKLFKVVDTDSAVNFRKYQQGEEIEIRHVEGSQNIYEMDIFAGGYQYGLRWDSWEQNWNNGDGLNAVIFNYAERQAQEAYEVATNATGLTPVTYQGLVTDSEVLRDIKTINEGIRVIREQLYNATSASGIQRRELEQGRPYFLLYNSFEAGYDARITSALEARITMPNDTHSVSFVNRPVVPIDSPFVPAGSWFLMLGGRKNIAAIGDDLMINSEIDYFKAGRVRAEIGEGVYKMVRDDDQQAVILATA